MRLIRSMLFFFAVLAVGTLAYADTIVTYDFSSMNLTENKGGTKIYGTVTGDVTIDTTTGAVNSGDFIATYGATTPGGTPLDSYTFSTISSVTKTTGGSPSYYLTVFDDPSIPITFDLEYTDVAGVVTLCSTGDGACNQSGGPTEQTYLDSNFLGNGDEDLVSGSFVAATPTPEPSGLVLLGTGLLCAMWVVRRRLGV